jgi:isocitrate/isopropylmalate dehydrogenase
LRSAIEACIAEGQVTPDLGGTLTTSEMTNTVIGKL